MPTGYTAPIADGTTTDLRTYALSCARAFGALVMLRDEPMDAAVTDEAFKPRTEYHDDALKAANALLARLPTMTDAECDAEAGKEYESAVEYRRKDAERSAIETARYDAMKAKVEAWTAPTPDHKGLRDFMLEQICISRSDYTPATPTRKTAAEWRDAALAGALRDVAYHTKEREAEIARAAERKRWFTALVASL